MTDTNREPTAIEKEREMREILYEFAKLARRIVRADGGDLYIGRVHSVLSADEFRWFDGMMGYIEGRIEQDKRLDDMAGYIDAMRKKEDDA